MNFSIAQRNSTEFIELMVATVVLISGLVDTAPPELFLGTLPADYDWSAFLYQAFQLITLYAAFLLFNFRIIPSLLQRKQVFLHIALSLFSLGIVFWLFPEPENYMAILMVFTLYQSIKYGIIRINNLNKHLGKRYGFLAPYSLNIALGLLAVFILSAEGDANRTLLTFYVISGIFGLSFYIYAFRRLIPEAYQRPKPIRFYLRQFGLILIATAIPLSIIILIFLQDGELVIPILLGNAFFQSVITLPFSWSVYRHHQQETEAWDTLRKERDQSTANVEFLRSQINPHFLFNVLNTLYGTALQEKAERTADGIQKLGDMMRFMLHENLKEEILLQKEIEYLKDYISLQRLRIQEHANIRLTVQLPEYEGDASLPPMLLIPFVENAFKHGIRLRKASYISVMLRIDNNKLYFQVENSLHSKSEQDTEAKKSGVGLNNVQERLALYYPKQHRLHIEQDEAHHRISLEIPL